jgi:hypothetical protein
MRPVSRARTHADVGKVAATRSCNPSVAAGRPHLKSENRGLHPQWENDNHWKLLGSIVAANL